MTTDEQFDAWNPGIESQLSKDILKLSTMFRSENITNNFDEIHELSDFTGLSPFELVAFRPERLIVHELLIHITADLTVPDGPNYEVLGINLRAMAKCIFENHIKPQINVLVAVHEELLTTARKLIIDELECLRSVSSLDQNVGVSKTSFFISFFGKPVAKKVKKRSNGRPEQEKVADLEMRFTNNADPLEHFALGSLLRVVYGVIGNRGRLIGDNELLADLALILFSNEYGGKKLGEAITPIIKQAAGEEGYAFLSVQEKPVIMNVKGASASGKSTIRPQQRKLAHRLDIPWEEFALISPDYWRKYLLEYESLGVDFKYGAMLTGHELEIIDKKLDRYMVEKAKAGTLSHLLIDRFRFDSFTIDSERESDSKLLTRFGDRIFMFFMVTSPVATVERAWSRGQSTGRYKAVDDLLYHNVEAYMGMPELFFNWAMSENKTVHFEFLDNNVRLGELPKTAAFGWNSKMIILDIKTMIDIDRFKKVNIDSKSPQTVFDSNSLLAKDNLEFLSRCFSVFPEIIFANQDNGQAYAKLESGELVWCNHKYIEKTKDKELKIVFNQLNYKEAKNMEKGLQINTDEEKQFTFGKWL